MNDSETLLNKARETQASPSSDDVSFTVETASATDAETLARECMGAFGVTAEAERLFPETPELEQFFRLRIAGVASDSQAALFSLGYRLSDTLGLRSCEPDIELDVSHASPEEADDRESVIRGAFACRVDKSAPSDSDWAIKSVKADRAWKVKLPTGGKSEGEGVLIGQIDTGINDHDEVNKTALKILAGANFIEGGFALPYDPLIKRGPLDNPSHGIGTASVAISRKGGKVTGAAPKAKLMPVRAIRSVIRITQSTVAQGVDYARRQGCDVITMSLGGVGNGALKAAIRRAVQDNIIVLAAAGNCVKFVTWPARYDECIAVGASNVANGTWIGSCRGPAVDVCAPGELTYRATRIDSSGNVTSKHLVSAGQGTSFSVAITAGVAALWLAHHGKTALIGSLRGGETLQERFRSLLRASAHTPAGWDRSDYGTGIVNAEALLKSKIVGADTESQFTQVRQRDQVNEMADQIGGVVATVTGMYPDDLGLSSAQRARYGTELTTLAFARASAALETTESGMTTLSAELAECVAGRESSALRSLVGSAATGVDRSPAPARSSMATVSGPNIIVPGSRLRTVSSPPRGTESSWRRDSVVESRIELGRAGTFGGHGAESSAVADRRIRKLVSGAGARRSVSMRELSALETIIGSDDRDRITNTEADPWRRICCLTIKGEGVQGVGTGWLVGPTTVITAGHCVFDPQLGGWAREIEVIPGRDDNEFPLGSAVSTKFSSVHRWVDDQDAGYDIGVIHLDPEHAELGREAGWFGIGVLTPEELRRYAVNVAGYPNDHRGRGKHLLFHAGEVLHVNDRRVFYDADTFGGNSGGPVWVYPDGGDEPVVVGIHAYGTGATPMSLGIEANSAPRILDEVYDLILEWRGDTV